MKRVTPWLLGLVVSCGGPWGCGDDGLLEIPEPVGRLDGGADADPRPPISAVPAPAPVSGGGLAIDGDRAVVSDPDHDRIRLFDLRAGVHLRDHRARGPGRMALAAGRAYVARDGGVDVIDLRSGDRAARFDVCPTPRGVAVDGDSLYVACLGGALHTVDRRSGDTAAVRHLPPDLRDVVVVDGRPWVSRFRTAELLIVDGERIHGVAAPNRRTAGAEWQGRVGWRLRRLADGTVALLHQWHRVDPGAAAYHRQVLACADGRVMPAITVYRAQGFGPDGPIDLETRSVALAGSVLAVDFAVAGQRIGLATPGDRSAVDPFLPPVEHPEPRPLRSVPLAEVTGTDGDDGCVPVRSAGAGEHRTVAVAAAADGLWYFDRGWLIPPQGAARLGEAPLFDSGHDYFHRDPGGGIACASCHPEGGDDGHTWPLAHGPRRTQPLYGGLTGTAPFHWDGAVPDFAALFAVVRGELMGGGPLSEEQGVAFARWLDTIPIPRHGGPFSQAEIDDSERSFGASGCLECHGGPMLSDGRSHIIDGSAIQTARLVGLGLRESLTHRGCAADVRERLAAPTADCGDPYHGPMRADAIERLLPFLLSR